MYDLSAFQTAVSVLGLRKSTTWVSYIFLAVPDVSPPDFQNQILRGLIFLVQVLSLALNTSLFRTTTAVVISFPLVFHHVWVEVRVYPNYN